jgi:hypothetical protein
MHAKIVTWLLAAMVAWQPIGRTPWRELKAETADETRARYTELATAAATVAFDPANKPIFSGKKGRGKTAALLITISWLESAFHNRVTTQRGSESARSDHGRSWCAGQILIGKDGVTKGKGGHLARLIPEGWSGPELEADPTKCLTVVYRFARMSAERCRAGALLGLYTGEGCAGGPKASNRLKRALSLVPPQDDDDFPVAVLVSAE